jgi:hypothetical protein
MNNPDELAGTFGLLFPGRHREARKVAGKSVVQYKSEYPLKSHRRLSRLSRNRATPKSENSRKLCALFKSLRGIY